MAKGPFVLIKTNFKDLFLIPSSADFVSALSKLTVEMIPDKDNPSIDEDYILLTSLLHYKADTKNIEIAHIKPIYKEYIENDNFIDGLRSGDLVYNLAIDLADNISANNVKLEDKIILSIAIRYIAEEYVINSIRISAFTFNWTKGKNILSGNSMDFLHYIFTSKNQTRMLFIRISQIGSADKIRRLDKVNIMTPKCIHINSFMYEPILDMDIVELMRLYASVKAL